VVDAHQAGQRVRAGIPALHCSCRNKWEPNGCVELRGEKKNSQYVNESARSRVHSLTRTSRSEMNERTDEPRADSRCWALDARNRTGMAEADACTEMQSSSKYIGPVWIPNVKL
jgi:hypothetical protein